MTDYYDSNFLWQQQNEYCEQEKEEHKSPRDTHDRLVHSEREAWTSVLALSLHLWHFYRMPYSITNSSSAKWESCTKNYFHTSILFYSVNIYVYERSDLSEDGCSYLYASPSMTGKSGCHWSYILQRRKLHKEHSLLLIPWNCKE